MSNVLGYAIVAERQEDVQKLAERAIELQKELTLEDKKRAEFRVFGPNEDGDSGIYFETQSWDCEITIKVVEDVVASFPEKKLAVYVTCEGPVCDKYVSENGELVEVEPLKDEKGDYLRDEGYNILFP